MMKKIFGPFCSFIILLGVVNCDNEPYEGDIIIEDNNCTRAILATNVAAQDYIMAAVEDSVLLCQVYRDALENQIEVCGDASGEVQEIIDFLGSCITIFNNPCTIARNATEIAFQDFLNAPTLEYETTCVAYVEAIENEISVCGDDGSLRALINELGDCQPFFFDITGDWALIAMNSNIGRDLDNDGEVTSDYFEEINCYTNESINFNSDGTGTFFYRSYAVIQVSSVDGTPDNIEYTINCIEESIDTQFTWSQIGLNSIVVTLNTDGTVLNFFRNADHIFLPKRNDFVATSVSSNIETIVQDLIYEYVQL